MISPQALFRGLVARVLPTFNADSQNNDIAARMDPYGGLFTQPLVRKAHGLADAGSYFVTNNGQSGIVPTYGGAIAATGSFAIATPRSLLCGLPPGGGGPRPSARRCLWFAFMAIPTVGLFAPAVSTWVR